MFCFFQANLMSSTYTDKTNRFHGVRISIPNWKPSPNGASIGFSQIAFPITVLPKDDHTDFAQEERLGLPYWTMMLAICVVYTNPNVWTQADTACLAHNGNLDMISMTSAAVICDADERCSVNTA